MGEVPQRDKAPRRNRGGNDPRFWPRPINRDARAARRAPHRQVTGQGHGHGAAEGEPDEAQIVAAECVTLAETKDHLNWELLGEVTGHSNRNHKKILQVAFEEVEDQEDEHLYHSTGWGHELWIDALGLPAVLPPPEERKDVKTAIGAARAKQGREAMTS